MTAKEYLQKVKLKDARISNLQRDKEALRAMMYNIGSRGEVERVQSSRTNDKFGTLYSRIDEKERTISKAIDELVDFKLKVSEEINALSDGRYITVLYMRYIQFMPWEQISVDMGYNMRYVLRLHGQALSEFAAKYKEMLESHKKHANTDKICISSV